MKRERGEQGIKRRHNSLGLNPEVEETLLLMMN